MRCLLIVLAGLMVGCDGSTTPPASDAAHAAAQVQTAAVDASAAEHDAVAADIRNAAADASESTTPAVNAPTKPVPNKPAQTATPAREGSPQAATVFREHTITDPGLGGMVAATLLVPEGWKVEGGMVRTGPQLWGVPLLVDLTVTAPDGRSAHFFPALSFEFGQQPAQPFSPTAGGYFYLPLPQSPGAWLMEMARTNPDPQITNLQLVSEDVEPDLTRQLQQINAPLYQMVAEGKPMAQQTGMDMHFDTQASKLVLTYQQDGKAMEETVLMSWQYLISTWQGQLAGGSWSIPMMRSAAGPAGTDYLNDPQLMAIFQSVRNNPTWDAEMAKYWNELARIRNKGNQDRIAQSQAAHQQRMKTLNETSDLIMSGWKDRNAVSDRGQERTIDTIHEVTPYQTPSGETVKLPSFYDNVYTDGSGRYLLNNDSLYNPNTDPAINQQTWDRIEPTR